MRLFHKTGVFGAVALSGAGVFAGVSILFAFGLCLSVAPVMAETYLALGPRTEARSNQPEQTQCPQLPLDFKPVPHPPQYAQSPFGFLDAITYKGEFFSWNKRLPELMQDLRVRWVKGGGLQAFIWKRVQGKNSDGTYTGFKWDEYDCLVRYLQANGMELLANIRAAEPEAGAAAGERKVPRLPRDIEQYKRFVAAVVERYDFDGHDDMPGLRYAVKYWLIEEEPFMRDYWIGTAEDYATTLSVAYDAVKSADPEATVIAAALYFDDLGATTDFAERFFKKLASISAGLKKYDMLDVHWFFKRIMASEVQYRRIVILRDDIWKIERKYFDETSPIIVTETTGIYSGEIEHAQDLFKRYIYAMSVGAKKVFWTALAASASAPDPFSKGAIVSRDATGRLVKRPAYHTYRLMASRLDGADFEGMASIENSGGLYVFKVLRAGRPVWIAWNDNKGGAQYLIKGVPYKRVRVTAVVATGGAFNTDIIGVEGGSIRLNLTDRPLIIEDETAGAISIGTEDLYDEPSQGADRPGRTEQRGEGRNGQRGRCGDGVCGPVEREKGVCPEDCR